MTLSEKLLPEAKEKQWLISLHAVPTVSQPQRQEAEWRLAGTGWEGGEWCSICGTNV